MKKATKILSAVALSLLGLLLVGVLAFYLVIVAGISPKLQSTWICSAMHTMNHKYLATAFFSDEYIEKVMEAERIDDSQHDSEILTFDDNEVTETLDSKDPDPFIKPEPEEKPDPYVEEGYELLEEGVYLKSVSGSTWRGNVMLVTDPTRMKLVDSKQQYYCGEKVESMIKDVGGIAGINGGGFVDGVNYDSNGGTPMGLIIEDGKLVCPTYNGSGVVYSMIGFNSQGAMILRHVTTDWCLANDIQSAVSALTFLVVDGQGLIGPSSGGWGIAPRTAIGQRKTGEVLLLVIDGRQVDWSLGCDLDVLEQVMLEENAYNAAMLDGGTSTVMIYNDEFINRPSNGSGRWINNCFVVMPSNNTASDVVLEPDRAISE